MKAMWARPNPLTLRFVLLLALAPLTLFASGRLRAAAPGERAPLSNSAAATVYGKLPLSFEVNQGQTTKQVKFLSRGAGYALFLTPTEAVLTLRAPDSASKYQPGRTAALRPVSFTASPPKPAQTTYSVLRIGLAGASPNPQLSGLD